MRASLPHALSAVVPPHRDPRARIPGRRWSDRRVGRDFLTDALGEVAKAYASADGGEVRFNFAASNVLARQIVNGAPADVFISADQVQMDYAQKVGAIDPSTRLNLLLQSPVIVTPVAVRRR